MKIDKGTSAKLYYTLTTLPDEKIIEKVTPEKPVTFTFGNGQLVEGFEKNLFGLQSGDSFDFVIKSADAYGPVDPYAIFDVPKDTFEVDGKIDEKMLRVGNVIPMTDNYGIKHLGKIIKVLEDAVSFDFNHPLAGKDLRFKGNIVDVFKI
ncbi:MAG: peptidylprolyl isomerase [Chlorobi bacterium]|nr:peptidylprolyl isomerase [Chlorobiota bacterium]